MRLLRSSSSFIPALGPAEQEGYVRIFADSGEPMRMLLKRAASRGIAPEYVARLLAVFDMPPPGRAEEQGAPTRSRLPVDQPLVEPLTDREMDVLLLLTAVLSNREIAQQLSSPRCL